MFKQNILSSLSDNQKFKHQFNPPRTLYRFLSPRIRKREIILARLLRNCPSKSCFYCIGDILKVNEISGSDIRAQTRLIKGGGVVTISPKNDDVIYEKLLKRKYFYWGVVAAQGLPKVKFLSFFFSFNINLVQCSKKYS